MQKKLKLIEIQPTHQKYYIMQDEAEWLGQGGFGIVKKGFAQKKPQQMYAVKIITTQDQNKRKNIQRQLKVLEKIPDHKNIVKSKLLNCFSEKNFYIFMQYCDGGTIDDQCSQKNGQYSEEQILEMFYQLMEGYQVLYNNKIVHQDIKSQNILIKDGVYKIADFGLAIINTNGQLYKKREGTRYYIAPQKFSVKNLQVNHKVDIYSFGILFFELIIGAHPYVNKKINTIVEFANTIKQAKLQLPNGYSSKFTIQFKIFFDLILEMIKKNPNQRITFEQVLKFIKQNPLKQIKEKQLKSRLKFQVNLNLDKVVITGISKLKIAEIYTNELFQIVSENQKNKEYQTQIIKQIYNYLCSRRIFIYFLDSLARRLIVQQIKRNLQKSTTNLLILSLLYFNQKISNQIICEIKNCQTFDYEKWKIFRQSQDKYLIQRVQLDWQHIDQILSNFIEESNISKADQIKISQIMNQNNFIKQSQFIRQKIIDVLSQKVIVLEIQNKNQLITIKYLFDVMNFLKNNTTWIQKSDEVERYYRKVEAEPKQDLINFIIKKGELQKIPVGVDISNLQFL